MPNKIEDDFECEYCKSKALIFSYTYRTLSIVRIECLMCGHYIEFQEVHSGCNHSAERYKRVVMHGYFLNYLYDLIDCLEFNTHKHCFTCGKICKTGAEGFCSEDNCKDHNKWTPGGKGVEHLMEVK